MAMAAGSLLEAVPELLPISVPVTLDHDGLCDSCFIWDSISERALEVCTAERDSKPQLPRRAVSGSEDEDRTTER